MMNPAVLSESITVSPDLERSQINLFWYLEITVHIFFFLFLKNLEISVQKLSTKTHGRA